MLIALLLPALQGARAAARSAVCSSNERQVYLAFAVYGDDFDRYFPWTWMWGDYLGDRLGGAESASFYGPRYPVLRCPAEARSRSSSWPAGITLSMYENYWMRSSYRTANMLYLDGHVGRVRRVVDGGEPNYVPVYYSPP